MPSILGKAFKGSYDDHVVARSVRRDDCVACLWQAILCSRRLLRRQNTRAAARNDMWAKGKALRELPCGAESRPPSRPSHKSKNGFTGCSARGKEHGVFWYR